MKSIKEKSRNRYPDKKVVLARGNTCLSCGMVKRESFEEVLELNQKRFDAAIEPYKDKQPYKRLCTHLVSINMDLMRYLWNLKRNNYGND